MSNLRSSKGCGSGVACSCVTRPSQGRVSEAGQLRGTKQARGRSCQRFQFQSCWDRIISWLGQYILLFPWPNYSRVSSLLFFAARLLSWWQKSPYRCLATALLLFVLLPQGTVSPDPGPGPGTPPTLFSDLEESHARLLTGQGSRVVFRDTITPPFVQLESSFDYSVSCTDQTVLERRASGDSAVISNVSIFLS